MTQGDSQKISGFVLKFIGKQVQIHLDLQLSRSTHKRPCAVKTPRRSPASRTYVTVGRASLNNAKNGGNQDEPPILAP